MPADRELCTPLSASEKAREMALSTAPEQGLLRPAETTAPVERAASPATSTSNITKEEINLEKANLEARELGVREKHLFIFIQS